MPTNRGFAPIESGAAYPLPELQRRTGWGEAALRSARQSGLKLRYANGRVFALGAEVIAYLETCPTSAPQEKKV